MPVVDATGDSLTLLWSTLAKDRPALLEIPKADLVFVHDTYPGGEEVAYLESC